MGVVYCADDLGASMGVNRGILAACDQGPIRRASVMALGFALEDAAKEARKRSAKLEIGLHLTLTTGTPLSPGGRRIAGDRDWFPPLPSLFKRAILGGLKSRDVLEELEAQWEKLLALGFSPTYVDGHHHVHLIPGAAQALAEFTAKKKLTRVRLLAESVTMVPRRRFLGRAILNHFSRRCARLLAKTGLTQRERSVGLCLWQAPAFSPALKTLVQNLPGGQWEVFLHPRHLDREFAKLDPEERKGKDPGEEELAVLIDPANQNWLLG